jgi:hypothetical protein
MEIYEKNDDIEQQAHFALLFCHPTFFEEAVKEGHWVEAMNEEIEANKSIMGVKWVYKTKVKEKGNIEKHKVRLVTKGFSQQPGIDCGEIFALVAIIVVLQ